MLNKKLIKDLKEGKIERWAMYNPKNDTFFGKPRNTRNECEASYKHAPLDYSPIKLEGTYYVDPD